MAMRNKQKVDHHLELSEMIHKEDELWKESLCERLAQKNMQAEHERENIRRQRMLVANAHS